MAGLEEEVDQGDDQGLLRGSGSYRCLELSYCCYSTTDFSRISVASLVLTRLLLTSSTQSVPGHAEIHSPSLLILQGRESW